MLPLRIVLLTGNALHGNPRVIKEANALVGAGFEVSVLGRWTTAENVERDARLAAAGGYTYEPLLAEESLQGAMHRWMQRIVRRVAPRSRWSFGLMPAVLARRALSKRPDLVIAHSEAALVAALVLQRRGCNVGVDMEDWFSEDLPLAARLEKPTALLRAAECELLRSAAHATCTTDVMGQALSAEFGCPRPTRIYNVFPQPVLASPRDTADRSVASKSLAGTASHGHAVRSIHWFSQTIGPGRGLEDLLQAAAGMPQEFEIHLRGNVVGYQAWLDASVPEPLRKRVFVHASVSAEELPERIAEHDLGFAGETRTIRNKEFTASNKIFQYMQSGLAVVASNTRGQEEVAAQAPEACFLFPGDDRQQLSRLLQRLISDQGALQAAQAAALLAAATTFNWEREKSRLVSGVAEAINRPGRKPSGPRFIHYDN